MIWSYLYFKFICSEKVTKFYKISTLLLTGTTQDKSKVEISHNFVAFSEYMNFIKIKKHLDQIGTYVFQLQKCAPFIYLGDGHYQHLAQLITQEFVVRRRKTRGGSKNSAVAHSQEEFSSF